MSLKKDNNKRINNICLVILGCRFNTCLLFNLLGKWINPKNCQPFSSSKWVGKDSYQCQIVILEYQLDHFSNNNYNFSRNFVQTKLKDFFFLS